MQKLRDERAKAKRLKTEAMALSFPSSLSYIHLPNVSETIKRTGDVEKQRFSF